MFACYLERAMLRVGKGSVDNVLHASRSSWVQIFNSHMNAGTEAHSCTLATWGIEACGTLVLSNLPGRPDWWAIVFMLWLTEFAGKISLLKMPHTLDTGLGLIELNWLRSLILDFYSIWRSYARFIGKKTFISPTSWKAYESQQWLALQDISIMP